MTWPEVIALGPAPTERGQPGTSSQAAQQSAAAPHSMRDIDTVEGIPELEGVLPAVVAGPEPFVSACEPLGAEIPLALKEKIWRCEYVEQGLLQKQNAVGRSEMETVFCFRPSLYGTGFQLQSQAKSRKIVSIEQWTSVFLIFAAIYMEKHGERGRELIKYMDMIRHAARRFGGYGWRE